MPNPNPLDAATLRAVLREYKPGREGETFTLWLEKKLEAASRLAAPPVEGWQPIETAPKGSWPDGPDDTRDPAYVKPPLLWLTLEDGQRCVGYFDAYYAEGGSGYDGDPPWVEEFSSERVRPTHWQPLPPPPPEAPDDAEARELFEMATERGKNYLATYVVSPAEWRAIAKAIERGLPKGTP